MLPYYYLWQLQSLQSLKNISDSASPKIIAPVFDPDSTAQYFASKHGERVRFHACSRSLVNHHSVNRSSDGGKAQIVDNAGLFPFDVLLKI